MFLHGYAGSRGFGDPPVFVRFMVNRSLEVIFNGLFEWHFFGSKRKKSRFFRRGKLKTAGVYPALINQGAAPC
jgi:hypothetical protein